MNKQQRKIIEKIAVEIDNFRGKFEDMKDQLEYLRDEEQEKFDNLTEGLQASERGQLIEASASRLEDAVNWFEYIDFDEIISALSEASGE